MKKAIILFLLVIGAFSCEKSQLKKPTAVNFALDLNKNFQAQDPIKLTSGTINIVNFTIDGVRLVGDDISFERNFSTGLSTDLNGSGEIKELDFELPQGEYSSIELGVEIAQNDNGNSFTLDGTYKPSQGGVLGLKFETNVTNIFSIVGEDQNQNQHILMDKDLGKKVDIEFNPIYWFESLTTNQLDNATVTAAQGQDYILLSDAENVQLYEIVLSRMNDSNVAIFK